MYETLYRKYRPQVFADIVGQDVLKIILQKEVVTGQVAHAYLFSGPRGVGKTSVARILAKAVNCSLRKEDESEPCNTCELCTAITAGKCFDVIEIDAASHTGVDNVRSNIIENARFAARDARYKVFIIDEVHMLSRGAFNALLKTLEDAPPQTIFILATTELHKVPDTIISRAEAYTFGKISEEALRAHIAHVAAREHVTLAGGVSDMIAKAADGSLRDALSLLGQLIAFSGNDSTLTAEEAALVIPQKNASAVRGFWYAAATGNIEAALRVIHALAQNGSDIEEFYDECIRFGQELLYITVESRVPREMDELHEIARGFGQEHIAAFIGELIAKKELMRFSPILELPLELAVVTFCSRGQNSMKNTHSSMIDAASNDMAQDTKSKTQILSSEKQEAPKIHTTTVTLADIQSKWGEFLERVSVENHSLPLLLRLSEPLSLDGGKVTVGVQYRFHKEKLNESKTRLIVEKLLCEVFGASLRVEATVEHSQNNKEGEPEQQGHDRGDAAHEQKLAANTPLLQNILREFGGRIVE